jgi:prepilin-type N-terminal cleavage/methylation domain-containing protein
VNNRPQSGFTLIELLVVLGIIALLASLLLPSIARAKESGRRTRCGQNLRQLQIGISLYASDNDSSFPSRSTKSGWSSQLKNFITTSTLLVCPTDFTTVANVSQLPPNPDNWPRSYVLNGFNDIYRARLSDEEWIRFPKTISPIALKESTVERPSETILFGEKTAESSRLYVDVLAEPNTYFRELEERRHNRSPRAGSNKGASNYALMDGSLRAIAFGKATCPVNMWCLTDLWRTNAALCRPR